MNILSQTIKTFVFVIIIVLMGCTKNHLEFTSPPLTASDDSRIAASEVTEIPSPSHSPSPGLSTLQQAITERPSTINPTLSADEADTYLLDLIINNRYCDLPCWWGIRPGVSTWHALQEVLNPLGKFEDTTIIEEDGRYETSFSVGFGKNNTYHNLHMSFSGEEQIIEQIYFSAENLYPTTSIFYSPEFIDALRAYSLQTILTKYGKPTRILLGLRGTLSHYQVILVFDQLGFLVEYEHGGIGSISKNPEDEMLTVCPSHENTKRIRFALQSPNSTHAVEKVLDFHGGLDPDYIQSLGVTTDISIQTFYDLFTSSEEEKCFNSPGSYWP